MRGRIHAATEGPPRASTRYERNEEQRAHGVVSVEEVCR